METKQAWEALARWQKELPVNRDVIETCLFDLEEQVEKHKGLLKADGDTLNVHLERMEVLEKRLDAMDKQTEIHEHIHQSCVVDEFVRQHDRLDALEDSMEGTASQYQVDALEKRLDAMDKQPYHMRGSQTTTAMPEQPKEYDHECQYCGRKWESDKYVDVCVCERDRIENQTTEQPTRETLDCRTCAHLASVVPGLRPEALCYRMGEKPDPGCDDCKWTPKPDTPPDRDAVIQGLVDEWTVEKYPNLPPHCWTWDKLMRHTQDEIKRDPRFPHDETTCRPGDVVEYIARTFGCWHSGYASQDVRRWLARSLDKDAKT